MPDGTKQLLSRFTTIPTRAEDRDLIERAQHGDEEARNELIERHVPFLLHCSRILWRSHRRSCGAVLDEDDALSICALATMHAIRACRLEKLRGRFVTYAWGWCRAYISRESHRTSLIPIPENAYYQYRKDGATDERMRAVREVLEMQPERLRRDVIGTSLRPDQEVELQEAWELADAALMGLDEE